MSYSDFTFPEVIQQLGLSAVSVVLFPDVEDMPASANLRTTLRASLRLASIVHTEVARSTWVVGPVLCDFWTQYEGRIGLWAGEPINVDKDAGLSGICNFILGRGPCLPALTTPLAVIFEAKRDDLIAGIGQCIAAMVGAQRFNAQEGHPTEVMYGAVTNGFRWKFLRLLGRRLAIDQQDCSIEQVDRILGILRTILGPVPAEPEQSAA